MKLRIKGNSIRIRVLRSELNTFVETGEIQETIRFTPDDNAVLAYGLRHETALHETEVRYRQMQVVIAIPTDQVRSWAATDQVGIYASAPIGQGESLEIAIEKDFACLDLSDADNRDTFPNPQVDNVC